MNFRYLKLLLVFFILSSSLEAKTQFFREGLNFYKNKKFDEAKFKFEQDLVLNPKSELSYLYLSRIFHKQEKKNLEEQNLKTVMLLNPKNEEAMYILIDLELERSNFSKVQDLKKDFKKICNTLCEKLTSIDTRLKDFEKKDAS